ncbi:MAG TPA: hypothetical protein VJ995_00300 [Geothermobacteraceae bacterium]|nr:hypothetical protein [Geothermobacteraceae bacterium]
MSSKTEYSQQRIDGSKMIIERAHLFAKAKGIEITSCQWKHPIVERDKHILVIEIGDKFCRAEFCDEWLADYPGGGSNKDPDYILREMLKVFTGAKRGNN